LALAYRLETSHGHPQLQPQNPGNQLLHAPNPDLQSRTQSRRLKQDHQQQHHSTPGLRQLHPTVDHQPLLKAAHQPLLKAVHQPLLKADCPALLTAESQPLLDRLALLETETDLQRLRHPEADLQRDRQVHPATPDRQLDVRRPHLQLLHEADHQVLPAADAQWPDLLLLHPREADVSPENRLPAEHQWLDPAKVENQ